MAKQILGPAAVIPRGEYDPGATYLRAHVVTLGKAFYMALDTVAGVAPPNEAYWMVVVDMTQEAAGLEVLTQEIEGARTDAFDRAFDTLGERLEALDRANEGKAPKWERVTPWAGGQGVSAAVGSVLSVTGDADGTVEHTGDGGQSETLTLTAGTPIETTAYGNDTLVASAGNIQVGYSPASEQLDRDLYVGVEASGAVVEIGGIARDTGLGVTADCVAVQDEVPTPEAPVAIVGAESVTVTVVGGENLADPSSFLVVNDVTVSDGEVYIPANRVAAVTNNVVLFDCPEGYAGQITLAYDLKHNDTTGASRKGAHLSIRYTDGTSQAASVSYAEEYAHYVVVSNPNKRVLSIRVGYSNSMETWMRNIMVCLGSVELPYEHYRGNSYQVALGDAVYGLEGAADAVDLTGGVVTRRTALKDFDGTESWVLSTPLPEGYGNYYTALAGGIGEQDAMKPLSTLLPYDPNAIAQVTGNGFRITQGRVYIRLHADVLADQTVAGIKAWLAEKHAAGAPFRLLYALASPVAVEGDRVRIPAYEGANTVYCDGAGVTVAGLQSAQGARDALQGQLDDLGDIVLSLQTQIANLEGGNGDV